MKTAVSQRLNWETNYACEELAYSVLCCGVVFAGGVYWLLFGGLNDDVAELNEANQIVAHARAVKYTSQLLRRPHVVELTTIDW